MPALNSQKKWQSTTDKSLQQGDLVWVVEDIDKRGHYNRGRVSKTIKSSKGAIRPATVQPKNGVYSRPVVKLAPFLRIDEDFFTKENKASDVEAEISQNA